MGGGGVWEKPWEILLNSHLIFGQIHFLLTATPKDYLELFIGDDIIGTIVENTNKYAKWCMDQNRIPERRRKCLWKEDLTLDEFKVYLGKYNDKLRCGNDV